MKQNPLLLALAFLAAVSAPAATLYVDAASTNAVPPYTNWLTAAAVIQDAVDAAAPGDEVVVTNGLYGTGGRPLAGYPLMTNRVTVDRAINLRSVNGPEVTVIQGARSSSGGNGDGAIRCVYLSNGAGIFGFTLTNGATRSLMFGGGQDYRGGGAWCESGSAVVSNCILTGNSAFDSGGGAYQGTLQRCTLTNNFAGAGGGAAYCTMTNCFLEGNIADGAGGGMYCGLAVNCTLTNNWASAGGGVRGSSSSTPTATLINCVLSHNMSRLNGGGAGASLLVNCVLFANWAMEAGGSGGGASSSWMYNCTVVGNAAESGGSGTWNCKVGNSIVYYNGYDNCVDGTVSYSCTPVVGPGAGNMTNEPLFLDWTGRNLRLQSNSPCINAGTNAATPYGELPPVDLVGHPRFVGGTVDMGAYENQSPALLDCFAWLHSYGLPTDSASLTTDPDSDRFSNYQEYRCLTDPTNALSFLRLLPPAPAGSDVTLTWPSGTGRSYVLECSTNLFATPPFFPLITNLPGQPGTTSFTVTNGAAWGPSFYRVGAE